MSVHGVLGGGGGSFCEYCGASVQAGGSYCAECGRPVEAADVRAHDPQAAESHASQPQPAAATDWSAGPAGTPASRRAARRAQAGPVYSQTAQTAAGQTRANRPQAGHAPGPTTADGVRARQDRLQAAQGRVEAAQAVGSLATRRGGGKRPLVIIGGVVVALVVALVVGLVVRAASSGQKAGTESASCKAGGSCVIGDAGPGGGIVFYAAPTRAAWGQYLEAAPSGWNGGSEDPGIVWCNKTDELLPGTFGTAIGTGLANTTLMVAGCSSGAGNSAHAYLGGGKNDWFLPSKDELNELYQRKAGVGGFAAVYYWSSSQSNAGFAWIQYFANGLQVDAHFKGGTFHVRPVRAF